MKNSSNGNSIKEKAFPSYKIFFSPGLTKKNFELKYKENPITEDYIYYG